MNELKVNRENCYNNTRQAKLQLNCETVAARSRGISIKDLDLVDIKMEKKSEDKHIMTMLSDDINNEKMMMLYRTICN